jgi:hypothetical protein
MHTILGQNVTDLITIIETTTNTITLDTRRINAGLYVILCGENVFKVIKN